MTTEPSQSFDRLRTNGSEPRFPFTAIVGQTTMKRALILNAVNTRIGGVLIRGKKGTAKGSRHFTRAEHYSAGSDTHTDAATLALTALDAIASIGSPDEREETSRLLMEALAASRSAEGRPF